MVTVIEWFFAWLPSLGEFSSFFRLESLFYSTMVLLLCVCVGSGTVMKI